MGSTDLPVIRGDYPVSEGSMVGIFNPGRSHTSFFPKRNCNLLYCLDVKLTDYRNNLHT